MSIGSRIRQARLKAGLSQAQLAKEVGVSAGAIGNYESGYSSPKDEILYTLMRVLNVDANFIYQDFISPSANKSEVDEIVEAFHKNKELAILFSRSAKLKPEDLEIVLKMVERMDKEDDNNP
jgi:transcriptional regulator with XRE-family HTH domain